MFLKLISFLPKRIKRVILTLYAPITYDIVNSKAWLCQTARPKPNTFEWYVHNLSKFEDAQLHTEITETIPGEFYVFPEQSKYIVPDKGVVIFGDFFKKYQDHHSMDVIPHRADGPAIIYKNGTFCWYFSGKLVAKKMRYLSEEDFTTWEYKWKGPLYDWAKDNDISLDNLSEDDITMIKLTWV